MTKVSALETPHGAAGPDRVWSYRNRPPRLRTCLNGGLAGGDGMANAEGGTGLDCRIHDLSEGGARITLAQSEPLRGPFYLIIVKYCLAYRAEVAWMKFPSRGLVFSQTYNLDAPLPDALKYLRKLWDDLSIAERGVARRPICLECGLPPINDCHRVGLSHQR